ncbi:hypothetical protein HYV72_01495 [Candidatus Uhrbacteria bacterium]|nr:hypothetical protein [Candidatus Uhrbacteria bacterium]
MSHEHYIGTEWSDEQIIGTLLKDKLDIKATIALVSKYKLKLEETARHNLGLRGDRVDTAVKNGLQKAIFNIKERPSKTSLFDWVNDHVAKAAATICAYSPV